MYANVNGRTIWQLGTYIPKLNETPENTSDWLISNKWGQIQKPFCSVSNRCLKVASDKL